jgi:dTDP-4-amino-4,6-dideoxygalactose transaminase
MAIIVPLYFIGSSGKILLVTAQKLKLLSMAVTRREKQGQVPAFLHWQFSPALGFLLLNQLKKLDRFTARRQIIARRYSSRLPVLKQLAPVNKPNWLRVPLRVKNRSALLAYAKKHHVTLGTWYDQPVAPVSITATAVSGYTPGSCPQAELAAATTINLPTHPNLTDAQIDQVIDVMSKARWARL